MQDRPYQTAFGEAVIAAYDQGWHQQIASMATGTGKTFCFSSLFEKLRSRLSGQMLVLAHTDELCKQNYDGLVDANPTAKVSMEKAEEHADPNADIFMASVQTVGRKNTPRLAKFTNVDKVVVDEAHHTPATSYVNVLEYFGVLSEGCSKLLLGVTATPTRTDGKALGEYYKKLVYTYSLRQAIEDGFLVKVRGYRVTTNSDISKVSITAGDLNAGELIEAIDTPDRNKRVVNAWLTRCEHRKTVVYSAGIAHAQHLAEAFTEAGIEAKAVWGEDVDRKAKLQWHKDTAGSVLVNANLLIEGYNDPSISCIVIAAPTASGVKFTQMCGRATRLFDGKVDCIILTMDDIAGAHSLITLPMLMGMPAGLDLQGQSITDAVKLIEGMQDENPNVDFTKLKDLSGIKQFIEQVNLFEIRFPKEVEDNSELRWCRAVDGGYTMKIPRPVLDSTGTKVGRVRIYQNMLDKWEIEGLIKETAFHGIRDSVEEAFAVADQQIRERSPESMSLLNRKAGWTNKPATKAQRMLLSRLYGKGKQWPEDLTQGQASHFIDKRIGGK
jgi:superfamily II DNA or RNA helicase